jgi:uncharacterized membrane protein
MNILSVLVGLFALVWALIAFVPLFGWMYWLVIPIAMVGYALGAMSRGRAGRGINLLVIVVGVVRLIIGHGIF